MSGSDGRYISIDSGPSKVRIARSVVNPREPGRSIGRVQPVAVGIVRRCGRGW
jgi:hypothetical protein